MDKISPNFSPSFVEGAKLPLMAAAVAGVSGAAVAIAATTIVCASTFGANVLQDPGNIINAFTDPEFHMTLKKTAAISGVLAGGLGGFFCLQSNFIHALGRCVRGELEPGGLMKGVAVSMFLTAAAPIAAVATASHYLAPSEKQALSVLEQGAIKQAGIGQDGSKVMPYLPAPQAAI